MGRKADRKTELALLAAVLALAAAVRIIGLRWGRPYSLHVDESFVVSLVWKLDKSWRAHQGLNPHASSYGGLPLYSLLFLGWAFKAVTGSMPLLYLGRLISAILSTLTVLAVYGIGSILWDGRTGLLGAAFLSVSVLAVRTAHFYTVDTTMVFWLTVALLMSAWLLRQETWWGYVGFGLAAGMATATKPTAVLILALPLLIRHRHSRQERGNPFPTKFLVGLALVPVFFFLWNPYAILDARHYFGFAKNNDLLVQSAVVRGKLKPLYTLQFAGTTPYLYILRNNLYWGMGLPLEIVALAGTAYSLWRAVRGSWEDGLILAWVVVYFLAVGGWYAKFVRYALPLLPPLALLAGRFLVAMWDSWRKSLPRWVVVGVGAWVLVFSLFYTLAYLRVYTSRDVRLQTLTWMAQNIPGASRILVEKDAALRFDKMGIRYGFSPPWKMIVYNPYEVAGVGSNLYLPPPVSPERKHQAFVKMLKEADYIVMSDSWERRFTRNASQFPAEAAFYHYLFRGNAEGWNDVPRFALVKSFVSYPDLLGLKFVDDGAELTWQLFDHPKVYVFERVGA